MRGGFLPARRVLLALVALVAGLGVISVTAPEQARAAAATPQAAASQVSTDSHVTVKWEGGKGSVTGGGAISAKELAQVQAAQPDHAKLTSDGKGGDAGSGHWDDFKDLRVTVSKTTGLQDEVVTVSASGMGAYQNAFFGSGSAVDFLQVMQCWGPDPNAKDFAKTCEYGGFGSGTQSSNSMDSNLAREVDASTLTRDTNASLDFPFVAVSGEGSHATEYPQPGGAVFTMNGLSEFFGAATTNEQPFVPMLGGRAQAGFSVQSASTQPSLGCGDRSKQGAGARCWLVVVPRGVHSGEWSDQNAANHVCVPRYVSAQPYGASQLNAQGKAVAAQVGSPVDPDCSYFQDRIVIPLDFTPTRLCRVGTPERAVEGTEAMSDAVSSWQPRLCQGGGAVYNLTTNSGDLVRSDLLTGKSDFALISRALTGGDIGAADPSLLDSASLAYGPVANTGLSIGFVIESADTHEQAVKLRLTPRLLAKMLTQSYAADKPRTGGWGNLTDTRSYDLSVSQYVSKDPEWIALGDPKLTSNEDTATMVVSGPQGDDAIAALWRYIQADADARAWLEGAPDPWGGVINPWFLSAGNPEALGGGLSVDLATDAIDSVPKADQSEAPKTSQLATCQGQRVDGTAYIPYSASLTANAKRIFDTDNQQTLNCDTTVWLAGNLFGKYMPEAPQVYVTGRFSTGPTTTSAADDYALDQASLALPLDHPTRRSDVATARTFVAPTAASMSKALSAMEVDSRTGVATMNYRRLASDAYPLTFTVNGAVNLASTGLSAPARRDYAHLMDYAAGAGNVPGESQGLLPDGYVPLTSAQRRAARNLADRLVYSAQRIEHGLPPVGGKDGGGHAGAPGGTSVASGSGSDVGGGTTTTPAGATGAGTGPHGAGGATQAAGADAGAGDQTPEAAAAALGGTLLAAAGGLVASPFLLRRKDGA